MTADLAGQISGLTGTRFITRYTPGIAVRFDRGYRFQPVAGFCETEERARRLALERAPDRALARVRVYIWRLRDGDLVCDTWLFSASIRTNDTDTLVNGWDLVGR